METNELKEFVDELRGQWKDLWRNRIDDKMRAEGISNQDFSKLFVEQGMVIVATKDYKPPDFVEILQKHISSDARKLVPPHPDVGGWGKFVKYTISNRKRLSRRVPLEPDRKKKQQPKKGGKGWLHFRRK